MNPFLGSLETGAYLAQFFAYLFFSLRYIRAKKKSSKSVQKKRQTIYLEILVNQGIIGLLIFITFISVLLKWYYSIFFLKKITNKEFLIRIIFFVMIIIELLPLRSYGSIFQTVNGSIFWFFLALVSSKIYIKK
jgi:hypothetical protein